MNSKKKQKIHKNHALCYNMIIAQTHKIYANMGIV